jgi:excinuclease ABC subunit C
MIFEEAVKIDYTETDSEIEALLLESEMIKRYKPKYNDRWKDEKNFLWIEITTQEKWPKVYTVRRPLPNKNEYLGPFVDSQAIRKSLRIIRRIFPYITTKKYPHDICFWGHIGQCPCYGEDNKSYRKNIFSLIKFLKGRKKEVLKNLEKEMKNLALNRNYEKAANIRDKIKALFKVSEMMLGADNKKVRSDQALSELKEKLGAEKDLHRIECYDVSNLFGKDATGSMVVFTGGLPDKKAYRRFKIKKVNTINDYASMQEILSRRLFKMNDEKFKVLPDLIVIDGGKGQLSASKKVLDNYNLKIEIIGLAKRNEEIFIKNKGRQAGILEGTFRKIVLPKDSHALLLLRRIRDEAHRFAIIHHRAMRDKKIKHSELDNIKGVGPSTKTKLLKKFKSVEGIKKANHTELAKIVGEAKTRILKTNL